jgi:hypothetical protein
LGAYRRAFTTEGHADAVTDAFAAFAYDHPHGDADCHGDCDGHRDLQSDADRNVNIHRYDNGYSDSDPPAHAQTAADTTAHDDPHAGAGSADRVRDTDHRVVIGWWSIYTTIRHARGFG